ncbi:putative geranylgeranyl diphosphate synthase [Aspergillus karnatakaensis]|uniref:polyprenyl synthetase family protein n=1 Tax=Aspergillus karnatakaensis TaxID=1810916 RepID=UPI003CCDDA4F
MVEVWVHSRPISSQAIRNTASFTTLPVRINERNDVANAATERALRDWDDSLHDGLADRASISFSELGNLGAFAYPEAPPERLAILTYLTDLGMLHDDGYEAMELDTAIEEHRDFGKLFDPKRPARLHPGTRAHGLKKLVSQILLEAIEINRDQGMYMFDMYNKGWLAVAGKERVTQFTSLEQYQAYRRDDFGLRAFWAMTEFALDIRLSDQDKRLVEAVMEPINKAIVWTNDYWSFDRESWEARVNGSRINNVVEVIRKTQSMSTDEAKAEARRLLIDLEQEYVKRKETFLTQHPSIPLYLRKWVEVIGTIVAGTHYWASSAPRHHVQQNKDGTDAAGHKSVDKSAEVNTTFSEQPSSPNDSSGADSRRSRPSTSPQSSSTGYSSFSNDGETSPKPDENRIELRKKRAVESLDEGSSPAKRQKPDGVQDALSVLLDAVARREERIKELEENRASLLDYPQQEDSATPKTARSVQSWYKPSESALQAPIRYICSMPSKGVRFKLLEAFNYWMKADESVLKRVGGLVDLLHNASLILDDIEDGSPKRRGKPSTHAIFGHSQAINSANYMFVQAVNSTRNFRSPDATGILLGELENLYLGQSWDLYWKYNLQCPRIDDYLNMVDNKTGCMFRLLLRLVQAETTEAPAGAGGLPSSLPALDQLTILFGRFFQIRDDYMNLCSGIYTEQKGAYEDLDEGKFSYPIVYCIAHDEGFRKFIHGVFRQQRSSITTGLAPLAPEIKEYVVEYLRTSGTFEHCRRYLEQMEAEVVAEIGQVEKATEEANPVLRLLLKKLSVQEG